MIAGQLLGLLNRVAILIKRARFTVAEMPIVPDGVGPVVCHDFTSAAGRNADSFRVGFQTTSIHNASTSNSVNLDRVHRRHPGPNR